MLTIYRLDETDRNDKSRYEKYTIKQFGIRKGGQKLNGGNSKQIFEK